MKVWVYDPNMAIKKIEAAGYKLNANYLTYFAAIGDYEWVKTYLTAGISPNTRTHYDNSFPYRWDIRDFDYPIIAAAHNRHIEIFRLLIEHGANAFIENNQGETAWMIVLQQGFIEAVKLLIEKGADVNSALIFTVRNCPFEVIKLLIDKGADVNAKDNYGRTALMAAASKGSYEAVKLLIEKGADVNAKDNDGRSAYDHTYRYYDGEEVRSILRKHGGRSGSGS